MQTDKILKALVCGALMFPFLAAQAEDLHYRCEGVLFGEQLPLRLVAIRKEKTAACGKICAGEPVRRFESAEEYKSQALHPDWIDKGNSQDFNAHLLDYDGQSKTAGLHAIKRYVFHDRNGQVRMLETRYLDYPLAPFEMVVRCDAMDCKGELVAPAPLQLKWVNVSLVEAKGVRGRPVQRLVLKLGKEAIEDKRPEAKEMRGEIQFGGAKSARLVSRVTKENVTHNQGLSLPASGSAELELNLKPGKFELNLGADEYIQVFPAANGAEAVSQRVEAMELKFTCTNRK